jgi:purine-binding chemotaxis protein CheW
VISPSETHPAVSVEGAADAGSQVLLVSAGGELFGVPLEHCREILEARSYTRIPGAGLSVCGMINLRGRLVTVLDLGVWLGRTAANQAAEHSVLVMEHEGRRVGLAVDQVVRIVRAGSYEFTTGVALSPPMRLDESDLTGSGWGGAPVFTLLDPDAIFQPALA